MRIKILVFAFFIGLWQSALGQDPQFTQFFAAPMYHNPAFTGGGYAPRVMMNYRNQWPSLSANFTTTVFSVDHFLEKTNSGIGLMVTNDQQGNRLKNSEITGLYSYELKLNESNFVRTGLSATYSDRGFDPSGLIFGDQIDQSGYIGASSDPFADKSNFSKAKNMDFAAGALYYNPERFVGVSISHILDPNIGYIENQTGSKIGRKFMVQGGYNFTVGNISSRAGNVENSLVITPTFLFKQQAKYSQLDFGLYATYSPLTAGVFYRGIPLKGKFSKFPNQDAVAFLVGYRMDNFSMGYSYDLTISKLGMSTGGSHEISISYQLNKFEKEKSTFMKQRRKELSCPKF